MVRAKFKCIRNDKTGQFAPAVQLQAVVGGSDNAENDSFFKATPSGNIEMGILNEEASNQFEPGKEYYVDFTPAD